MVDSGLEKDNRSNLTKGWSTVKNNVAKISDLVMNMLSYTKGT